MVLNVFIMLFMLLTFVFLHKITKELEVHREIIKKINGSIYADYFGSIDSSTDDKG